MRRLHVHRVARALTAALALTALAVTLAPAPPASAAPAAPCPGGWVDKQGRCHPRVGTPVPGKPPRTGTPRPPSGDPNPGGNPESSPDTGRYCEWHVYPDQAGARATYDPGAPPDAEFGEFRCFIDGRPIFGPYVPTWVVPGEDGVIPDPPPTPAEVAADGYVEIESLLNVPELSVSPKTEGGVVPPPNFPTFVEITNWQEPIGPIQHCLEGVCVNMAAEPELTFTPGEPGSSTRVCKDGGTVYDDGRPARDQVAEPACAWIYERRTINADGTPVNGRPAFWTAEIAITWTVTWWVGGGPETSLDPIEMTTTFQRAVHDQPTVITDFD
jgi:hypothetical protein